MEVVKAAKLCFEASEKDIFLTGEIIVCHFSISNNQLKTDKETMTIIDNALLVCKVEVSVAKVLESVFPSFTRTYQNATTSIKTFRATSRYCLNLWDTDNIGHNLQYPIECFNVSE